MPSLQQLLGKEDKFLGLFERSAEECCRSVELLRTLSGSPSPNDTLKELIASRHRDKAIHLEITEELCSTPVTALDREDVLQLGHALYKIPKIIEKIGERILLAPAFLKGFELDEHILMLEQATRTLRGMVQSLRNKKGLREIRPANAQLQIIEGAADHLVLDVLKQIYQGEMEGRQVVFLKDLFELIEEVTDRCRDAGNIIVQIVLKSS